VSVEVTQPQNHVRDGWMDGWISRLLRSRKQSRQDRVSLLVISLYILNRER
jgi:hypothetical protein